MIKFDNVSLKYKLNVDDDKDYIIKDLSLEIEQGEFICILGPSGCGKSSLLGMLAGFVKATQGQILFENQAIQRPSIDRTLIFQEYALFPWLNVIENISFGLKNLIKDKEERLNIASRYLEMVGLIDHARDKISNLSGGMKQRVAIARALAVKPKLLLMDEPFGALDEKTRMDMQKQIIQIWQKLGMTVVFVTHSIDEALILADRIIVMNKSPLENVCGEIKADVKITTSRPRNLADLSKERELINANIHQENLDFSV